MDHKPELRKEPTIIARGVSAGGNILPLHEVAVLLHPHDDVAIARMPLGRGVVLRLPQDVRGGERLLTVRQRIQSGHKIALRALTPGEPVHRYDSIIGFATSSIEPGEHIHSHNLAVGALQQDYAYGVDLQPVSFVPVEQRRAFLGYKRPDGRAGTRNCMNRWKAIWTLMPVKCSMAQALAKLVCVFWTK